jgi:hypothetical protein
MSKTSQKQIKKIAKEKLDLKKLFPRTEFKGNRNFTPYQLKKIKKALHDMAVPEGVTGIIYPDRPEHYEAAGFLRDGKKIFTTSKRIKINFTYKHHGKFSFYNASFFGGVADVQLMPLSFLPTFLEEQIMRDDEYGQWYDKIALREGDRDFHGMSKGFGSMKENAEELYLHLIEYKRKGALIGEGGTFEYIQVCFINFGG